MKDTSSLPATGADAADANQNGHGNGEVAPRARLEQWAGWLVLLAIVLFVVVARVRYLSMPLERDEGEYAHMGQLMLQGVPPYRESYGMKFPGTYLGYAILEACFGQTIAGLRWGLMAVNLATLGLVFLIARRVGGMASGLGAAAAYAILSQSPALMANMGHATHFLNLATAGGVLLLVSGANGLRGKRAFAAGICLGFAVLAKQHAAVLAAGLWLMILVGFPGAGSARWRAALAFLGGCAVPFLAVCGVLGATRDLASFWFWTISYAAQYAGRVGWPEGWINFRGTLVDLPAELPLIILGLVGCGVLALRRTPWGAFTLVWFVLALLTAVPGLLFRPHYFIPVILPASIAIGMILSRSRQWVSLVGAAAPSAGQQQPVFVRTAGWLPLAAIALCLGTPVIAHARFMWVLRPEEMMSSQYTGNPFNEVVPLGESLKRLTAPGERIGLVGSEPQLFFYANRRSATGYLYVYPLMEDQPFALQMQRQMAAELEKAQPRFLVFEGITSAWLRKKSSPGFIFDWVDKFTQRYRVAAVIELQTKGSAVWTWNPPPGFQISSSHYLVLYQAK